MNGLILVDKAAGCTSHDVVNRWRRLAGTKRVGHLGTLDPMATGLLALVTGTATRLAQYFGNADKTYEAEITLGKVSDTYDVEGDVREAGLSEPPSADAIRSALKGFEGAFMQTPPPVSAKKIQGVPAYKLARKQIQVELTPVEVHVRQLIVHAIEGNQIKVAITSSAGTYIRSIAHDLGVKLGCGAVLSRLRRTRLGEFTVERAWTLEVLMGLAAEGKLSRAVIPSSTLLPNMPTEYVDEQIEMQIRQGRDFRSSPFVVSPGAAFVKAVSRSGELIAIGQLRIPNVYHPVTVL